MRQKRRPVGMTSSYSPPASCSLRRVAVGLACRQATSVRGTVGGTGLGRRGHRAAVPSSVPPIACAVQGHHGTPTYLSGTKEGPYFRALDSQQGPCGPPEIECWWRRGESRRTGRPLICRHSSTLLIYRYCRRYCRTRSVPQPPAVFDSPFEQRVSWTCGADQCARSIARKSSTVMPAVRRFERSVPIASSA